MAYSKASIRRKFVQKLWAIKINGIVAIYYDFIVARTIGNVAWLENQVRKKPKYQNLQTDLAIGLYEGYIELNGNEGLGERAPK